MISCQVCPHYCILTETTKGICGARTEKGGASFPLNYGMATVLHLDPIEKKPLAHFYPGSYVLSYGSYGCNMRCTFCQNFEISMLHKASGQFISPQNLTNEAILLKDQKNIGVAYTYNEPTVDPEFIVDTGRLVHAAGMKNIVVSNGYTTLQTLDQILEVVDAFNFDLKAFTEEFYKKMGGSLEPVKASIAFAAKRAHVEVTTLVIPGENDSPAEMDAMCRWLSSISPDIPLHLSRFFPAYKMLDKAPTPAHTLKTLELIARKYLNYVHLGNL